MVGGRRFGRIVPPHSAGRIPSLAFPQLGSFAVPSLVILHPGSFAVPRHVKLRPGCFFVIPKEDLAEFLLESDSGAEARQRKAVLDQTPPGLPGS